MRSKTIVPNPHLTEGFHLKQGGHQDFGSYPFNRGLLEAQHQAGDKAFAEKEQARGPCSPTDGSQP